MLITNFASGELSPTLNGRVDLQQYYHGASHLENFDIIPTGGIKRRSGSKRLLELTRTVEVPDPDTEELVRTQVPTDARIIPFILDKDNVFIFAMVEKQILVYKIESDHTATLLHTLETYYASLAECREVQYAQNYDTMILVHRNYKPVIIQYSFNLHSFLIDEMHFDFYPDVVIDDDYDFIMLPVTTLPMPETTADGHLRFIYSIKSGNATVQTQKDYGSGISKVYCVLDGHLYQYEVATGWQPSGSDPDIDEELFTVANKHPACVAFFNNRLFFACSNSKHEAVWASATPDTQNTRYNDFNTYKKYLTVERGTKEADIHTFTCDVLVSQIDHVNHTAVLSNVTQNFTIDGTLIKNVREYFVTGSVIPVGTKVLSVTSTSITVDTDNIRIEEDIIGQVMTIQLWKDPISPSAEDYEYVVANTNVTTADCGFYFELASDENDSIKFLASNRFMAIGTESSIWSIEPGINALNIAAQMQGRYGSDDIQGMAVAQATIYFAQGKKGIREFYYDTMSEGFLTNNIAILAEHLLQESPVVDFDYISNPYSRILCTRYDGTIASLLYDKTNGVMGWSRITRTKGKITGTATTRGNDENDYTFIVVEDGGKYYLEMIDPGKEVYLDSWKVYDPQDVYQEGAVLYNTTKDKTCTAEDIPADFIEDGDLVYIGYPIRSYIKSMPVIANDPTGKKRITNLIVRFLTSYMPLLKVTGLADQKFTTITQLPYSGVANITYPGSSDRDVYFELEAQDVKPVNILSVNANIA